jgi:AcrR family transcriptional regulator
MLMARRAQRDWLLAGLHVLADTGSQGITIERLCARLAVTKGSFYHHFTDVNAYKTRLLRFAEEEGTLAVIAQVEAQTTPRQKLDHLLTVTLQEAAHLEVALRAWALQDAEVRAVQERIDARRLAYLDALCRELLPVPHEALTLARMLYTLYIGSHHQLPPLASAPLHEMYQACLRAFSLS